MGEVQAAAKSRLESSNTIIEIEVGEGKGTSKRIVVVVITVLPLGNGGRSKVAIVTDNRLTRTSI